MAECEPVSMAGCVGSEGGGFHRGEATGILIGEENLQEQQDEVLAMQSIYEGGEEERIQVISQPDDSGRGLFQIQIMIPMIAPAEHCQVDLMVPVTPEHSPAQGKEGGASAEGGGTTEEGGAKEEGGATAAGAPPSLFGKGVPLQRSLSGQRWTGSFNVQHLCPLTLHLTLPPTYPSRDPPAFSLSCVWLRRAHVSALCRQLDKVWEENANLPIVFTWMHWLENQTFSCLGLTNNIIMMPEDSSNDDDNDTFDGRALVECEDFGQAVHTLRKYNSQMEAIEFCKALQECCLCLEEKLGTNFFRLDPCKHHFCFDCMAAHANLHVTDGTIQLLTCPGFECKAMVLPNVLQMVLSPESFLRWETLSLQRSLDEMWDVVYCPRCQAVVIREQDETLKLGHCLTCCYSFCTECEQQWHVGTPCQTELDRLEEQGQRIQTRDERARLRFEELRRIAQEKATETKELQKLSRKCPRCKIPIQKIAGCNSMTCRCGERFCWICGQSLQDYNHFYSQGTCALFDKVGKAPAPVVLREPEALLWIRAQVEKNEGREFRCAQCKQTNLKVDNNNHVRCWNCKTNICFHCRGRISGIVTRHFSAGSCPQHS